MNPQPQEGIAVRFTRWIGSVPSLIVHTILFALSFASILFGADMDTVLLVLTTIVSLEAIYLAIFIQMSVNRQTETIQVVEENIDEIQEDIGEIQEDVDEIQEDVVEIQEDVDEIQEDVGEITTEDTGVIIDTIHKDLKKLLEDVERLKKTGNDEPARTS